MKKVHKDLAHFRDEHFPKKLNEFITKKGNEILKNIKDV